MTRPWARIRCSSSALRGCATVLSLECDTGLVVRPVPPVLSRVALYQLQRCEGFRTLNCFQEGHRAKRGLRNPAAIKAYRGEILVYIYKKKKKQKGRTEVQKKTASEPLLILFFYLQQIRQTGMLEKCLARALVPRKKSKIGSVRCFFFRSDVLFLVFFSKKLEISWGNCKQRNAASK